MKVFTTMFVASRGNPGLQPFVALPYSYILGYFWEV